MRLVSLLLPALVLFPHALAAPAAAQEALDLRQTWKVGEAVRYRIVTEMEQEMSGLMEMSTTTNSSFAVRQTCKEVGADGTATLALVYDALKIEVENSMMNMSYDSTRKGEEAKKNSKELASLGQMVGQELKMKVTSRGKVLEVIGLGELLDKMMPDGGAMDPTGGMLKQMFNEEALKQMFAVSELPDRPVKPGDTWDQSFTLPIPMLGGLKTDTRFALVGAKDRLGKRCAEVKIEMGFAIDKSVVPEGSPMAEMMDISLDMKDGKGAGTIWFDLSNGRLLSMGSTTHMEMSMAMRPKQGGDGAPAMEMQIGTDVTTSIESIPLDAPPFGG